MSFPNLAARPVVLGQTALVRFRRVQPFVVSASGERLERPARPALVSRPSLRESPRLEKSTAVEDRQVEPTSEERESAYASSQLAQDLSEETLERDSDPPDALAPSAVAEQQSTDSSDLWDEEVGDMKRPPNREESGRRGDYEMDAEGKVLVVKRSAKQRPMHSATTGGGVDEKKKMSAADREIAQQVIRSRRKSEAQRNDRRGSEAREWTERMNPNVIVAKRPGARDESLVPPPPMPPPPAPLSSPGVKRVDNVLVVPKTSTAKSSMPRSRNGQQQSVAKKKPVFARGPEAVESSKEKPSGDVTPQQDESKAKAEPPAVLVKPRPRPIVRPQFQKPSDSTGDVLNKGGSDPPAIASAGLQKNGTVAEDDPVMNAEGLQGVPAPVEGVPRTVKKALQIRSSLFAKVKEMHKEAEMEPPKDNAEAADPSVIVRPRPKFSVRSQAQNPSDVSRGVPAKSDPRPPLVVSRQPQKDGVVVNDRPMMKSKVPVERPAAAEEKDLPAEGEIKNTNEELRMAEAEAPVRPDTEQNIPSQLQAPSDVTGHVPVQKDTESPAAAPEEFQKDTSVVDREPEMDCETPQEQTPQPQETQSGVDKASQIRSSLLASVKKLHEETETETANAELEETKLKDDTELSLPTPPADPKASSTGVLSTQPLLDLQTSSGVEEPQLNSTRNSREANASDGMQTEVTSDPVGDASRDVMRPEPHVSQNKTDPGGPSFPPPLSSIDAKDKTVRAKISREAQDAQKIRSALLKAVDTFHENDEAPADNSAAAQPEMDTTAPSPAPQESQSEPSHPSEQPDAAQPSPPVQGGATASPATSPSESRPQTKLDPGPKLEARPRAVRPSLTGLPQKPVPSLAAKPAVHSSARSAEMNIDRQILLEKNQKAKEEYQKTIEQLKEKKRKEREKIRQERKAKRVSNSALIGNRRRARQDRQIRRRESDGDIEAETIIEVGPEGLSVEALAAMLAVSPAEVIKVLFVRGVMVTVNQTLDMDSVKVVGAEMGVDVVDRDDSAVTEMAKKGGSFCEDDDELATDRPPVVTVMGHVDHGKTSLLDYIRNTTVVKGEAGGITQAIGAYTCSVEVEGEERTICFLDTPGHEAFSAMRARGTRVTDIAIIIIAANDGVRPQTLEAISHAKAAEVPLLIAINKIDVPGADPDKVKRELSEIELLPEEWGGKTPVVEISAKTGEGVKDLLEMLTLVADIQLNLLANPEAPAKGTVIEAFLDKRSGVLATVLVQNGTLHVGDAIVAGGAFGKVRSLMNAAGSNVEEAGPSVAVQMLGFHDLPVAGDLFSVCEDETQAKEEAEKESQNLRARYLAESAAGGSMVTLSSLASVDDEDATVLQRINLVLKADTSGSLEAVKGALAKLPQEAIKIRYLHAAAGEVTESDVLLAAAAEGMIVGFNVPISDAVKSVAKQKGIALQSYSVIYHLIDDVRAVMEGRLSPTEDRIAIGQAEVRAVFGSGSRRVAGCMVTEGRLEKGSVVCVMRKKACVFEGPITSLRRVKDDVEQVAAGLECGVGCVDYSEWQEGDRMEAFTVLQKRMTLEESQATMAVDEEELQQLIG